MDPITEYNAILERLKTAPANERPQLLRQAEALAAVLPDATGPASRARAKVLTPAEEKTLADVRAMMLWPEIRDNADALRGLVKTCRKIRGQTSI